MPEFTAAPDLPKDGLGEMLLGLIRQNMEDKPEKIKLFKKLKGRRVAIVAPDSEVAATLSFGGDNLTVFPDVVDANVTITADSMEILGLTSVPLRLGLPDLFTPDGRSLLTKILKGEVHIKGMLARPLTVIRITKIFSVV
ncbi:MAG: hypothetical protein GY845_38395 [Planctomycetes bacterium]|nr:hypothetical protein [Planctomycetota bacterium]